MSKWNLVFSEIATEYEESLDINDQINKIKGILKKPFIAKNKFFIKLNFVTHAPHHLMESHYSDLYMLAVCWAFFLVYKLP